MYTVCLSVAIVVVFVVVVVFNVIEPEPNSRHEGLPRQHPQLIMGFVPRSTFLPDIFMSILALLFFKVPLYRFT